MHKPLRRLVAAACLVLAASINLAPQGNATGPTHPAISRGPHFLPSDVADLAPDDVYLTGERVLEDGSLHWQLRHWDGTTWSVMAGTGENGFLNSVTALSSDDIWAVGIGTAPYATLVVHGHPGHWDVSRIPGSSNVNPTAIVASSDSDVWVLGNFDVGLDSLVVAYHFDGKTWTSFPPFAEEGGIQDATSDGKGSVWAVGYRDGHSVRLHWGGSAWRIEDSTGHIEGLGTVGRRDIWGVGDTLAGVGPLTIHWDGHSWTDGQAAAPDQGTAFLIGVAGSEPDNVWAAGYIGYSSDEAVPLIERWDGEDWTQYPVGTYSKNPVTRLFAVDTSSPDDAWAVGSANGAPPRGIVEHWDGTHWHRVQPRL